MSNVVQFKDGTTIDCEKIIHKIQFAIDGEDICNSAIALSTVLIRLFEYNTRFREDSNLGSAYNLGDVHDFMDWCYESFKDNMLDDAGDSDV
jgi:hypothetical protein